MKIPPIEPCCPITIGGVTNNFLIPEFCAQTTRCEV
jgi:hypothetical protein